MPQQRTAPQLKARPVVDEILLVRDVSSSHVWQWLAAGWEDFRDCWQVSVPYAFLFVVLGFVVTFGFYFMGWPYLVLPGISGFLLVGPAAGIGFYEISRRRAAGERATLMNAILAFRRNTLGIMGLGICLVFLLQVWIRLSFTVFALNFPGIMPDWEVILQRALTMEGVYFAFSITALGSVFATLVFFAAAFALPMQLDRKTTVVPAMITSGYAVFRNKTAMALWAAVIVVVMGAGLIPAFLGLVVTFPLIGHATWHAYKDVVREEA